VNSLLIVLLAFALTGVGPEQQDGVVTVNVPVVRVSAGTSSTAVLELRVKDGYHIQADSVADEFLVPTRLAMETGDFLRADTPDFPPAVEYKLQGTGNTWMVYSGRLEIRVPFGVPADAPEGGRNWRGTLTYQACEDGRCLPPDTLEFHIPVDVL